MKVFSHVSESITRSPREELATTEGESELARGDESDSDSWLEKKSIAYEPSPLSVIVGLSLPVGPRPKGGRSSGGHPTIFRSLVFSSWSSATLCSRAYWQTEFI